MIFANNSFMKILLTQIMYEKNVSVRQLSQMTGIPKSTINNIMIEKYSPTLDNLEKIARVLKVLLITIQQAFSFSYRYPPMFYFIKTPKQINPSVYRIISIKQNEIRTNVCEMCCTIKRNGVY